MSKLSEQDVQFEHDFSEYVIYTQNRPHIINSGFHEELKKQYELLFIFSKVIHYYEKIDDRTKLWDYICETKNDLILSFDLLNMNYHSASKRILRSAIESYFRFSLCLSRYIEYKDNLAAGIYSATDSLKDLKSMVDTHKVGKMTHFTIEYFSETCVSSFYSNLNLKYSGLSGNVHVNKKEFFTPQRFLTNYLEINTKSVVDNLEIQNKIILDILLTLYYFDLKCKSQIFEKKTLLSLEDIGGQSVSIAIDTLESFF